MTILHYISTAGRAPPCDLEEALLAGLAPDGGLYLPHPLEEVRFDRAGGGGALLETAVQLAPALFGDEGAARSALEEALDFSIPLVPLSERLFVLELFHGPSLAFKDVGARVLARLLERAGHQGKITVITATSGDTGGAVAAAFAGGSNSSVFIIYPRDQVTERQERQFATVGGNVHAIAVNGTFDDCQRLTKEALADPALAGGSTVTSANSVNVGRLLPQAIYYAHACRQLPDEPDEVVVSVPSGNLGNLTAGLIAKRVGVPITHFVAATNANDVFPSYLSTGRFTPQPSVRTLSSAMDVGDPSNLARIRYLYDDDPVRLRRDVSASSHTDEEVRSAITQVFDRFGYVMDPHTAVGYLALVEALEKRPSAVGVVLATAHPAKFAEIVEPLIGESIETPPQLAAIMSRPVAATHIEPSVEELRAAVQGVGTNG